MRIDTVLTRRDFLRLLASLGMVLATRQLGVLSALGRAGGRESLGARLLRLFRSPASAAAIGRAYLQKSPREADEPRLLRLLCSPGHRWQTANTRQLRLLIRQQQVEDFKQGRLVRVDGWMLSETEARLCALAALREGSPIAKASPLRFW